jgi:hypothetical protein
MPPAVANAVYDAVGVRVDELPITSDKVLAGLDLAAKGKPARVGPKGVPAVDWGELTRIDPVWYDRPVEEFIPTRRRGAVED